MYKMFFNEIEVFNSNSLDDVVGFALSMHKASNIPHTITVYDPIRDIECLTFIKKPQNERI